MTTREEQIKEDRVYNALIRIEGMSNDVASIKQTMQQVADALTRLAVVEERQLYTNASLGRAFKQIDDHEERIVVLEMAQPLQKQTTDWVHKAMWLVVGAVIAAVLSVVMVNSSSSSTRATYQIGATQ